MKATSERRGATRRDVYWCFAVSIVVSVLALGTGIVRTQQLADDRVRDRDHTAQVREADLRANQAALAQSLVESDLASCRRGNEHDGRLVDYVEAQVERGKASLAATLASPAATPEQKMIAVRNLVGAAYQADQLRIALKPEPCVKSPAKKETP